ncbi:MAG: protein TolR [Alphaproteobacteria bacterium]
MGSQPSSKRRGGARRSPMSEINVTPMVDVMLVLLIIFMVAAPLLTVGVPVNLPQTTAAPLNEKTEPLAITIKADGQIYIQDTVVALEELAARLQAITENKPDTRIYVRGDHSLDYGRVMEVMGLITSAGFSKVALITETPGAAKPGKK